MPIYEYSCNKCGKTIEVIQKFSDPILKKHQGCGGSLTKLISASGFQFKGTGWYVTDYARKTKGGESEPSKETDGKEKKEAVSQTDSTPKEAKESKGSRKTAGKTGKPSD
jgi:putative FmdB family regulatory protein